MSEQAKLLIGIVIGLFAGDMIYKLGYIIKSYIKERLDANHE
jgi:hypothetical protein